MLLKGLRLVVSTLYGSSPDSKVARNLQRYGAACCVVGISCIVTDRKDGSLAIEDDILLACVLCCIMHGASYDQSMTERNCFGLPST